MGNEPDEEQQMIHMLVCSNEFDLEGLIAVTGAALHPGQERPYKRVLHPELFHQLIDAYEEVYHNLQKHADGWHSPDYLRSIVMTGQTGYGVDDTGEGKSSPGSRLISYSPRGQDDWAREHIRTGHGALGALYPARAYNQYTEESPNFIEGGGTIPWLIHVPQGLTDPSEPSWGGWSGRYSKWRSPEIYLVDLPGSRLQVLRERNSAGK